MSDEIADMVKRVHNVPRGTKMVVFSPEPSRVGQAFARALELDGNDPTSVEVGTRQGVRVEFINPLPEMDRVAEISSRAVKVAVDMLRNDLRGAIRTIALCETSGGRMEAIGAALALLDEPARETGT